MTENITKISVALGDLDRKIVMVKARELGLSFSAALRIVIREWQKEQRELEPEPCLDGEEGQG